MSNPAHSIQRPTVQVITRLEYDETGRAWEVPYPGLYRSGSVRLIVDRDHAHRVDITIDGYWVAEQATVDQAMAWVNRPKSQTIMERLWAWVAL